MLPCYISPTHLWYTLKIFNCFPKTFTMTQTPAVIRLNQRENRLSELELIKKGYLQVWKRNIMGD